MSSNFWDLQPTNLLNTDITFDVLCFSFVVFLNLDDTRV